MKNVKDFNQFVNEELFGLSKKDKQRKLFNVGGGSKGIDDVNSDYYVDRSGNRRPDYIFEDDDIFDKIEAKIKNNFDVNKVKQGYVAYGDWGYIYELGQYLVKISDRNIGMIKKEENFEDTDIDVLDVDKGEIKKLYDFIIKELGNYQNEKRRARKDLLRKDLDEINERKNLNCRLKNK